MDIIYLASSTSNTDFWADPKTWTALLAIALSVLTLLTTYRWTIRHKEIDITMHFQEAYDALEMLKKTVSDREDSIHWFTRYWHLQARQFEYWLRGYIPDEKFIHWMKCRRNDHDNRAKYFAPDDKPPKDLKAKKSTRPTAMSPPCDYREGWEAIRHEVAFATHPYRFVEFMETIFACEPERVANHILGKKCFFLYFKEWKPKYFRDVAIGYPRASASEASKSDSTD